MQHSTALFTYYNRQYVEDDLALAGIALDEGLDVEAFVERHLDAWLGRYPMRNLRITGSLAGGEFAAPEEQLERVELVDDLAAELRTRPRGAWSLLTRTVQSGSRRSPSWIALMHDGLGYVLTVDMDMGCRPGFDQLRQRLARSEVARLYFAERCRRQTARNLRVLGHRGWIEGLVVHDVVVAGVTYCRMRILTIDSATTLMEVELHSGLRLPLRWGGFPEQVHVYGEAAA